MPVPVSGPRGRHTAYRPRRRLAVEALEGREVPSSYSGTAFDDQNGNATRDPGEPGPGSSRTSAGPGTGSGPKSPGPSVQPPQRSPVPARGKSRHVPDPFRFLGHIPAAATE
jgi:hypothetical protein